MDEDKVVLEMRKSIAALPAEQFPGLVLDPTAPGFGDSELQMRFCLRARDHNVAKATKMLSNLLQWRRTAKPELLSPANLPNEMKLRKAVLFKQDQHGRPAIFVLARLHISGEIPLDETVNLFIYVVEEAMRRMPSGVHQFIAVVDLSRISFKSLDLPFCQMVSPIVSDMYPERLGRAILINVPVIFESFWKVVSLLLDKRTVSKFTLVGKSYRHILAKEFEPQCLPAEFGGTGPQLWPDQTPPVSPACTGSRSMSFSSLFSNNRTRRVENSNGT